MEHWTRQEPVFDSAPDWAFNLVPDYNNVEWAPDISYHNGKYYLYYSVSQFGRNNSAIGVATNKTLYQDAPDYKWVDHGLVVQSVPGRDMWNAIDPNLAFDDKGTPWLTFGSFWKGIKIVKMQDDLLDLGRSPQTWHSIAARQCYWKLDERDAGDAANPELDYNSYSKAVVNAEHNMENGAIEAPFIFKKNDFYYLFVSWDRCCRGKKSTYKIMVGRSKNITGPYLDKANEDMLYGGGSLVAKGSDRWAAVGHEAAYTINGQDYLIFHGYDNNDRGISKLVIKRIH